MKFEPLTKTSKCIMFFHNNNVCIVSEEQLDKINTFTKLVIKDVE